MGSLEDQARAITEAPPPLEWDGARGGDVRLRTLVPQLAPHCTYPVSGVLRPEVSQSVRPSVRQSVSPSVRPSVSPVGFCR